MTSNCQQPAAQAHRQVSYEAAEVAEDSAPLTLVTESPPQRNCQGGGSGGCYGVIGVALCAFVLGCLLSFAVTLLATRPQFSGGGSSGGVSSVCGGLRLGEWPDAAQLKANRARLRALADDPGELEGHVAALSRRQSRAGTGDVKYHADYVSAAWSRLSLPVINRTYSVLLSFLDTKAVPKDQIGVFLCRSPRPQDACTERLLLDRPLTPDDGVEGALHSIVPYTKPLDGRYRIITQEKLAQLAAATGNFHQLALRLAGTVVLVDYGIEGGDAPNATLLALAAGVLKKLAPEPQPDVEAYPKGTGVPDTLIWMKSTLNTNIKGDPSTPMYPSREYAVRGYAYQADPPSQPTVPLSAADVRQLRSFVESTASSPSSGEPHVLVRWPMRTEPRPIKDVCTEILGAAEPDRVVLIGGHRDAWHSGALDPHSGLSSLLVISRVLADLRREGWRPRRTLLMCTWDAEEWNLMGSAEWLDEELRRADKRLVAYVNTDTDIMGNWKVMVHAFQRWHGFLDELIAEVPNPDPEGDQRYHFYKAPDAYSDYYVFWRNLGVPIVDLSYIRPNKTKMVVYDLYHSRYDTVRLYRMTDPGSRAHLATVRNYLGIVYTLLDSPLLPVNLTAFAEEIEAVMLQLAGLARVSARVQAAESEGPASMLANWISLDAAFKRELSRATRALRRFQAGNLSRLREAGPAAGWMQLRMANDKLMEVQRAFVYRSIYPIPDLVNLLADEPSIMNLLSSAFNSNISSDQIFLTQNIGQAHNLRHLERLMETCILSLTSVSKVLSDSFAD